MDKRRVDPGEVVVVEEEEEGKSGVSEVCEVEEEERELSGREGAGAAQEGGGGRMRVRLRMREMERTETETSFRLSLQGHGSARRFLEGELVEVRQREKGLRGSWHPAVVVGVKPGRRVVEYDELLTDDGREKLTESIPVDRCLDGGRGLGSGRQPWRSYSKTPRTLLRPRPPPLPNPSSISLSKGLSVDCYLKDAWWEGVLIEAISGSGKHKRVWVWFPEEEDWEAMPVKDMRVGQQWDEDTGEWSLKGCVDIPFSKRGHRPKTMSLSQNSRGFGGNRRRRMSDGMELAMALKTDGRNCNGRDVEYTSAWNSSDRSDDAGAMISVQLNSPKSASFTPRQAGTDRSCGEERKFWPLALRTRSLDSFPKPLSSRSPRTRTRGDPSLCASLSFGEGNDNAASSRNGEVAGMDEDGHLGVSYRFRMVETVEREILDGVKQTIFRERTRVGVENGDSDMDATENVGQHITPTMSPEQERGVKQLVASGWTVTRNFRSRNLRTQWYYKSPNGCLLGSLASALGMRKRMEVYNNTCGDEENPTLSDILSPKSRSGRTLKSSRRIASPTSVKEGGLEMDQLERSITVHVNGDAVSNSAPPAGSNGTWKSSNADCKVGLLSSHPNSKRTALDSEFIVDFSKLNELKRRKVLDSPAELNEPRSGHSSMLNGGPIDWPEGIAGGGVSLETTPLTDSKPLSKSLDDGPATEIRSKKRAFMTDRGIRDQGNDLFNARNTDDSSLFRDGSMEVQPRSKKGRVIIEASWPSEGKSRKSLAILQESSRKKGCTPHKGGDFKQAKKGATQVKKSASHVKKGKKSRTPSRTGVRLEVLLSAPGSKVEVEGGELTKKRTLLSWLIDNGTVSENEKVRYLHRKDLHCMLEGVVTRDGILCNCCKKTVTLSVFEAHAGSKLHRPSANIFLDDGRSLSVCQVEALALKSQSEADGQVCLGYGSLDKSDDTCGICGDGGELICCDHCPSTFHLTCMGLQEVPDGDWYCPNCRCASCGDCQFNGDQTTFNDLTVIFCDQCECEYHVKCLRARGLSLTSLPQEDFFCGDSCGRIFQGLRGLVGECNPMERGFSSTLLRSAAEDDRKSGCILNTEINAEHDSKLSIALSVMQECFRPMIDPRTKIDIITHVLYNRRSDVSRLNYHGFYTMLLERGDELISVATIRVHGARLAELPLIGTRFQYRRQGMCRRLVSAIEEMLHSLGVECLVLPAVPELLETWTGAFGFKPMDESERLQLMDLNIMAFPGTSILYKRLENVVPQWSEDALPPTVNQSSFAEIVQPRLQKEHSDVLLAPFPVICKRRPGRPPKIKGDITKWGKGLTLALPVGAHKLGKSGNTARLWETPVASQYVTVKRGPGRPPKKGKARFKPRVSMAVLEAHGLSDAGCYAGYVCSPTDGFLGKAVRVTNLLTDGVQQEKEQFPSVIQRKRGRPPRAKISNNSPANGVLSTTATSIQFDQVAGSHGGEQLGEAAQQTFPNRLSNGRFTPSEGRGDFECGNSAIVPKTMLSMPEVKTPLWLVESGNEEVNLVSRNALAVERSCKTLKLEAETDVLPLASSMAGSSTRTYERRRSVFSPPSQSDTPPRLQDNGSHREPTFGRLDFLDEDFLPPSRAECRFRYEAVSVPIRTFPSHFSSRSDHNNTAPGTFIPVETIVVNSQPKVETLEDFLVPQYEDENSHSGRDEQKCGKKLLLRLKLPKKKMSLNAVRDLETAQPSPASTTKLPKGGLLPPAFTLSEHTSKEMNPFEQFDKEQLRLEKASA